MKTELWNQKIQIMRKLKFMKPKNVEIYFKSLNLPKDIYLKEVFFQEMIGINFLKYYVL